MVIRRVVYYQRKKKKSKLLKRCSYGRSQDPFLLYRWISIWFGQEFCYFVDRFTSSGLSPPHGPWLNRVENIIYLYYIWSITAKCDGPFQTIKKSWPRNFHLTLVYYSRSPLSSYLNLLQTANPIQSNPNRFAQQPHLNCSADTSDQKDRHHTRRNLLEA